MATITPKVPQEAPPTVEQSQPIRDKENITPPPPPPPVQPKVSFKPAVIETAPTLTLKKEVPPAFTSTKMEAPPTASVTLPQHHNEKSIPPPPEETLTLPTATIQAPPIVKAPPSAAKVAHSLAHVKASPKPSPPVS